MHAMFLLVLVAITLLAGACAPPPSRPHRAREVGSDSASAMAPPGPRPARERRDDARPMEPVRPPVKRALPSLADDRPVALRRRRAAACGVDVLAPEKFRHERLRERSAVLDTYRAESWWGSLEVMCVRFDPSETDPRAQFSMIRGNLGTADGWETLETPATSMGSHDAIEIDAVSTTPPAPTFLRYRLALAGNVIHIHRMALAGIPGASSRLAGLLPSARLATLPEGPRLRATKYRSRTGVNPGSQATDSRRTRGRDVWVRPYSRADGTQVRGHWRSRPVRHRVRSYTRKDGTHVRAHWRGGRR